MPYFEIVKTCHFVTGGRAVTYRPGAVVELSGDAATRLGSRVKPAPRPKPPAEHKHPPPSDPVEKGQQ